ncbi:hypothetical protein BBL97_04390 [Vibrio parahaemolyticus]|uniref:hypothetical protein n=1 Tax=Vibrio parahaemolyticus TaxID=670 RepID=UPI00084A490D|nr:hypothetical protein [Vibrio parahaemolyticus]ODW92408.1 hypothetical protein BBL95_12975 [Vibrio parahaemolyticus]ODX07139.1 hypothetical protein BBL96_10460 [Vibrio parahaemolyticus]ODX10728.1 hypothetical protein BBL97_04390 [Vibrio parahaemolyticus]ODX14006.1 hypothetical protein BBL98_00470 [Vibrio parahaemolyticus]ODX18056.1 hypothetical protein BBL99_11755 [Vibrio parahaemolyticus]
MKMKEILLTLLKILMVASIVAIAFVGGDMFEMFRDGILQEQGFAIPISGFMFQIAAILCLVAVYPVDLMRDKEVQGFKRFAIMSIKSILLIFLLVNFGLIVSTLLNFEFVMLQVIFFSAAIFSFVFSYKMLISVSNDSNDSQILSNINGIQALCLTTIVSMIAYQGAIYSPILFSVLFSLSLIFTAFIAIYHSKIRWNQQNGIKEIA